MNLQTFGIAMFAALKCAIAEGWSRETFVKAAGVFYDKFHDVVSS